MNGSFKIENITSTHVKKKIFLFLLKIILKNILYDKFLRNFIFVGRKSYKFLNFRLVVNYQKKDLIKMSIFFI